MNYPSKKSKDVEVMEKILITGASSGIGRELARNLAGRSRKMYLLARSENKLNLLKKELEEKNFSREEVLAGIKDIGELLKEEILLFDK